MIKKIFSTAIFFNVTYTKMLYQFAGYKNHFCFSSNLRQKLLWHQICSTCFSFSHLIFLKEWETHHFLGGQMFWAEQLYKSVNGQDIWSTAAVLSRTRHTQTNTVFYFFSPQLMGDWLTSTQWDKIRKNSAI